MIRKFFPFSTQNLYDQTRLIISCFSSFITIMFLSNHQSRLDQIGFRPTNPNLTTNAHTSKKSSILWTQIGVDPIHYHCFLYIRCQSFFFFLISFFSKITSIWLLIFGRHEAVSSRFEAFVVFRLWLSLVQQTQQISNLLLCTSYFKSQ